MKVLVQISITRHSGYVPVEPIHYFTSGALTIQTSPTPPVVLRATDSELVIQWFLYVKHSSVLRASFLFFNSVNHAPFPLVDWYQELLPGGLPSLHLGNAISLAEKNDVIQ